MRTATIKPIKFFFIFVLIVLAFAGCQEKRKYYYQDTFKGEQLFEAYSDDLAYWEAYTRFIFSQKMYGDIEKAYGIGVLGMPAPKTFKVLNERHEDITQKLKITDMHAMEDSIKKNIASGMIKRPKEMMYHQKWLGHTAYDTTGLYTAPIKMLSLSVEPQADSNFKNIAIQYKNIGDKAISFIEFSCYGKNALNDTVGLASMSLVFEETILWPNETRNEQWSAVIKKKDTILMVCPVKIGFKNGTIWSLQH